MAQVSQKIDKELDGLKAEIREAATDRTWSSGVTLARDGKVTGRLGGNELEFEVRVPGKATPFTAILNPTHGEWECDCPGREEVCAHVVAAVLALVKAREEGDAAALPQATSVGGNLRYDISVGAGGLLVARSVIARNGSAEPLKTSVAAILSGKPGPKIATVEADLLADAIIPVGNRPIAGDSIDRLLTVLAGAREVRYRNVTVTTSPEPVLPLAVVDDGRDGVRVRLMADPDINEVVTAGVVRLGTVLRPIGVIDLCGPKLERLPQAFDVPSYAYSELISKTLPALAARIPVEIRAKKLPKIEGREKPRMNFDVSQDGDSLHILPTLVYGDPPRARVDNGKLVPLGGTLPFRDDDEEKRLMFRLRDELNLVPGRRVTLNGRDAMAVHAKLGSWMRLDAHMATDVRSVSLEVDVQIDGTKFGVEFAAGGKRASAAAVLRAWQARVDMVPLEGGGWGKIPMSWLDKHGARVADILATRGTDNRVPLFSLPDLARLCEDLNTPPPLELTQLRPLLADFAGLPKAKIKKSVASLLRPYQVAGIDWLAFCRDAGLGCVLADDMGLGKTLQALAAINGRTLVVTPTSVLFNWLAEAKRFRPDLRLATYHGARRQLDTKADVLLTTYPILRNDIDEISELPWDAVILDESQTIKNPDSQVARAAYKLRARWRLTLSGTPVENRLDELWSQLHFTNPGLLGGRADFQERWGEPIASGDGHAAARLRERIKPFVLRRLKRDVAQELPPRTDSVMYVELDERERLTYDAIRAATQAEIVKMLEAGKGVMAALEALLRLRQACCHTGLLPAAMQGKPVDPKSKKAAKGKAKPEIRVEDLQLNAIESEEAAAEAAAESAAESATNAEPRPEPRATSADANRESKPAAGAAAAPASDAVSEATATSEVFDDGSNDPPEAVLFGSSKITRLLNALEDAVADGHKALVFSQWTSLLNLIEPHLKQVGIRFTRLDGNTKDRAGVVKEFQSEGGPPVILLSLKAGGTGLNLTAADHVFLLDPWWNPAVEEQAADRAHRIGQDKPVMVYRLVARDTVEERILALQETKRNLADAALGQADRATAITRDDLLALLS